ncbi:MAG: hypothetical protein MK105_03440 [Crocinitomicaceae bacterium]|nr:hypothetical protein [Crocinitomicaceae bacterium]
MIKYNPKNWFKLIFALHKSDTMRILWKEIIYIVLFTLIISFLLINYFPYKNQLGALMTVYSLIGFVISLLLVFRTNTGYERWWEGRKQWGKLVNNSRNLAIKITSIVDDEEDIAYFKRMLPNFVFAMKEHLRQGVDFGELDLTKDEIADLADRNHIPNGIVSMLYKRMNKMKKEGKISQEEFITLDTNLNALLDILGACERIKNTPIPYSYSLFIKKFIFIYVTTIPLAFIPTFGYFSVLIAAFIFYVLVSMEILAEEIEDPFGKDANDLPTGELSIKIRDNVREIMG